MTGWPGMQSSISEIIPERDTEFGSGAHQSEERIATVAAIGTACAAADLALGDMKPDVARRSHWYAVGSRGDRAPSATLACWRAAVGAGDRA